ncbi:MAG: nicotinamide mononucleotide transporter [Rickettsiaceae bacterium]|nr:nicotinamide mononucleotide transporter [Rickettsiaceae bacterium]
MNYLDFIGTVLSLIGTYYFVKADIRMWLVYILATIVNSILYFKYTMYASMILEIGYLVMSVYGFASWHIAAKQSNDYIRSLSYKQYPKFIIIWLVIIVIIYGILITFSDSTMPKLETIAVSTSIIACYYLLKRR